MEPLNSLLSVTTVGTAEGLINKVNQLLDAGDVFCLNFLNMHASNIAYKNREFLAGMIESDILVRDGVGIEFAMRFLGISPGENLNGTDLIPRILLSRSNSKVVLLGSTDEILKKSKLLLLERYNVEVVGSMNGFDYDDDQYVEYLAMLDFEFVILAMGMPKQELLSKKLKECGMMKNSTCIISGGAILSFLTGAERRAPEWIRYLKMEWFWRLCLDPKRLYRRFVIGGFNFFYSIIRLKIN